MLYTKDMVWLYAISNVYHQNISDTRYISGVLLCNSKCIFKLITKALIIEPEKRSQNSLNSHKRIVAV